MMRAAKENKPLSFFGIGKILPYVRPYRRTLLLMTLCGLAGSAVDIAMPLFQRHALNRYVSLQTLDTLPYFIVLYLVCIVFAGIVNYISMSNATKVEVSVNRDLRNAAFDHLQTLSFSYFNQNSVGYIHARVMSDTARIGGLVSWSLMDAVWQISYLLGAMLVMFAINARLALLVTLLLPLIFLLFSVFQKKLIRINREIRELNSHITGEF